MPAAEVAQEVGKPLLTVTKYKRRNRNGFHISAESKEMLQKDIIIGYVEDVTSTNNSLLKLARHPYLRGLEAIGVGGLRRGIPAPLEWTAAQVDKYNRNFAFKPPLERRLPFRMGYVIERPLPLWIPVEKQLYLWLPELTNHSESLMAQINYSINN